MRSDVVGGLVEYRFDYVAPHEGKTYSEGKGKGLLKFADPGVGWRIGTFTAKDAGGIDWIWITQLAYADMWRTVTKPLLEEVQRQIETGEKPPETSPEEVMGAVDHFTESQRFLNG